MRSFIWTMLILGTLISDSYTLRLCDHQNSMISPFGRRLVGWLVVCVCVCQPKEWEEEKEKDTLRINFFIKMKKDYTIDAEH